MWAEGKKRGPSCLKYSLKTWRGAILWFTRGLSVRWCGGLNGQWWNSEGLNGQNVTQSLQISISVNK